MIAAEDFPVPDKLDLILEVLRANELHQEACELFQVKKAQLRTGAYLTPGECNCWLSVPAPLPLVPESEIRIDVYRPGTSWDMDMSTVNDYPKVRITHIPTGITEVRSDRSVIQAKVLAWRAVSDLVAAARG